MRDSHKLAHTERPKVTTSLLHAENVALEGSLERAKCAEILTEERWILAGMPETAPRP